MNHTLDDKIMIVAKEVFDEAPHFTNKQFRPESVNECYDRLKILLKKEHLSEGWIDSVYDASIAGNPIYIDLSHEWYWNFLTLPGGTKVQLLEELSKLDPKKIRFKK